MRERSIKLLDVVILREDHPEAGLSSGQAGTVVELLAPGAFEVEFLDDQGRTLALIELQGEKVLLLRKEPMLASRA